MWFPNSFKMLFSLCLLCHCFHDKYQKSSPLHVTISNIEPQTGALASQATLYTYFYTNDTLLIDFEMF